MAKRGGFPGGGMGNMGAMMKHAQKMQVELARAQEEIKDMTFEASAGGGMVKAVAQGDNSLVSLTIDPEAVDPEDVEMLQDMITAAVVSSDFHVLPGTQITVCTITLRNGTKVLGYNYGAIDPARQDWKQGRQAAYDKAREKVWELEGYALRERLVTASATLEVAADPEADKAAQVLEVVLDFFRSVEDRTINLDPPYAKFLDRLARAIGWEFNENPKGEEAQP